LLVTALMLALSMSFGGVAFAKQAQTFEKGKTTTHQGNSEHSPVVSPWSTRLQRQRLLNGSGS
jgi:hypothetical protein